MSDHGKYISIFEGGESPGCEADQRTLSTTSETGESAGRKSDQGNSSQASPNHTLSDSTPGPTACAGEELDQSTSPCGTIGVLSRDEFDGVLRQLTPASLLTLSQTCKEFRSLVLEFKVTRFQKESWERGDLLDYEYERIRHQPELYFCDFCARPHTYAPPHPEHIHSSSIPQDQDQDQGAQPWRSSACTQGPEIEWLGGLMRLNYSHFQTALKCHGTKHDNTEGYLQIMQPKSLEFQNYKNVSIFRFGRTTYIKNHCESSPQNSTGIGTNYFKIVNGQLLSISTLSVTLEVPRGGPGQWRFPDAYYLRGCYHRFAGTGRKKPLPYLDFTPGAPPVKGSCGRCQTDWELSRRLDQNKDIVTLRVWKNFGSYSSLWTNEVFREHTWSVWLPGGPLGFVLVANTDKPPRAVGSVQQLYETASAKGEVAWSELQPAYSTEGKGKWLNQYEW